MEILTVHLQIGTHNMGFSAQFPAKKGPGNLTPNGMVDLGVGKSAWGRLGRSMCWKESCPSTFLREQPEAAPLSAPVLALRLSTALLPIHTIHLDTLLEQSRERGNRALVIVL